ncbi:MAG: FAD-dependent oxidoreductase, partial [Bacteroidetes bacterium]|nr:FAD-dependent oxidoreductase [Bacteroidota bacterium]
IGSLENDLMAINDVVVRWLPYGFYYKMFHKPKWVWKIVEPIIRKAAGIGSIDTKGHHVDTRYEKRYRFPEVCVIGAGPAGLAAAKGALDEGKKVLLIEEQNDPGGRSLHTYLEVHDCQDASLNGLSEN